MKHYKLSNNKSQYIWELKIWLTKIHKTTYKEKNVLKMAWIHLVKILQNQIQILTLHARIQSHMD